MLQFRPSYNPLRRPKRNWPGARSPESSPPPANSMGGTRSPPPSSPSSPNSYLTCCTALISARMTMIPRRTRTRARTRTNRKKHRRKWWIPLTFLPISCPPTSPSRPSPDPQGDHRSLCRPSGPLLRGSWLRPRLFCRSRRGWREISPQSKYPRRRRQPPTSVQLGSSKWLRLLRQRASGTELTRIRCWLRRVCR